MSRQIEVDQNDGVPKTSSVLAIFEGLGAAQLAELATILAEQGVLDLDQILTDSANPGLMRRAFRALVDITVGQETSEEKLLRVVLARKAVIRDAVLQTIVNGYKPNSKLPAHAVKAVRDSMDRFAQSMPSEGYERRLSESL